MCRGNGYRVIRYNMHICMERRKNKMVNKRVLHRGITYDLNWLEIADKRPALSPIPTRPLGRSTMQLQGPYNIPVSGDKTHSVYRIKAAGQTVAYLDEDTLYLRADTGYYTKRLIKGLSSFYNIAKLGRTGTQI